MIGSVTEMQDQLAAIEKRRKGKPRGADSVPDTGAQVAAEAHMDAMEGDQAAKAYQDCGATGGPSTGAAHHEPDPRQLNRPYESAGHAAPSPQHEAPRSFPVAQGQPEPAGFGRPYLAEGHAADSPAPMPVPRQIPTGLAITHGGGLVQAGIEQHYAAGGLVPSTFVPHNSGR